MNKIIEIFSLGEQEMTLLTLANAIGYNVFELNYGQWAYLRKNDKECQDKVHELLKRLKEEDYVITVKRLYYRTVPSEYPQYECHVLYSAHNFLRSFKMEQIPYILQDTPEMRQDLETLILHSPPLHEEAFKHLKKANVESGVITWNRYPDVPFPNGTDNEDIQLLLKVDGIPMPYLTATLNKGTLFCFSTIGYPESPWTTLPEGIKIESWAVL